MQTICRLIQLTPADGEALLAHPAELQKRVAAARLRSDVYRYWDAIRFLLSRHRPETAAARWLELGRAIPGSDPTLPHDRVLMPADVAALHGAIGDVAPEDLAPHYDAGAMDAANVYPATWRAWEEDFDPLGQVLEHYYFLQEFVARCASEQEVLLLHFDLLAEGSV